MDVKKIEKMFIENFKNNTSNLNKRVTKYSYGISISTKDLSIDNNFSEEGIAFCPKDMIAADVPLNVDNSTRVLREAIESLFSVHIQEERSNLDGDYHGYIFIADNKLGVESIKIEFSLYERINFYDIPNYIIELPSSEFNFDSTDSPKDFYFKRKSEIGKFVGSVEDEIKYKI